MTQTARRVLVTGATGFIGSRCLPRLLKAGFEVHAVTSRPQPAAAGHDVIWHHCDLQDGRAIERMVAAACPDHLLHLAWIATPGKFWTSSDNLQWLSGGVMLAQAFFRNGGRRALGVGTCAEYEWVAEDCVEATTPLHPATIYGRCKLAMGLAFAAAAAVHGGSAAWGRLFFPYGLGEPAERLIPAVIRGVLKGEPVACTHGRQIRDFIYVDDVAAALVALLDSEAEGPFNVGSGTGKTLRDVVAVITESLGRPDLVRFGARQPPPGDPERVVANVGRLRRSTGWRPAVDLHEGIARTIADWRQRLTF